MAQIYANSAVTISTGSSGKCSSGFLKLRKPSDVGIKIIGERFGRNETVVVREFESFLGVSSLRCPNVQSADVAGQCKRGSF
jgi:hypothetical protein